MSGVVPPVPPYVYIACTGVASEVVRNYELIIIALQFSKHFLYIIVCH
jgi:hypothetical protein